MDYKDRLNLAKDMLYKAVTKYIKVLAHSGFEFNEDGDLAIPFPLTTPLTNMEGLRCASQVDRLYSCAESSFPETESLENKLK